MGGTAMERKGREMASERSRSGRVGSGTARTTAGRLDSPHGIGARAPIPGRARHGDLRFLRQFR